MGMVIQDNTTLDILALLNKRFGPAAITEMVALQKEFAIFSSQHSLEDSFTLLGIVPCEKSERDRWYSFLDSLKKYKSDLPNVNGYNRVIKAFEDALTVVPFPPIPKLPVFVGVHAMDDDDRVTVSEGRPLIFSVQPYVILSIPTKPGRVARQQAADAAKKRRAAKTKSKK